MNRPEPETIGIVGLGAIGASLALALRDRLPLRAWARSMADRDAAQAAEIDVCDDTGGKWASAMTDATVVLIAVPISQVVLVLAELLPSLRDDALVLHTASLQRREVLGLDDSQHRRVLGTHPMAGSERSGFFAASGELFRGVTVRAESRANETERERIETLWHTAGAGRIVWSDAAEHDRLMAWVSHLPQVASTALAAVLSDAGVAPRDAGPGARDVTRLAASDLGMWSPILTHAPRESVEAVRRLAAALDSIGDALQRGNLATIADLWSRARGWRMRSGDMP